jgi:RNA polymerase sigma factor (sigma-70 family)
VTTRKDRAVLRQLNTLFNIGAIRELTDGQLLERFATGRGEAAELAFAALVERHGAMVLRVCRAQLADPHDTQDAFQATFLILVKKARALWVRDSLGPWLHQVAFRTATCARSAAARRRTHERRAAERTATADGHREELDFELGKVLHEEINRLPERYRVPIVLCDLEGHTCEEAARRMGRPVGTVKCWRARGRERLRNRLTRFGLAPSAALAATLAADAAGASALKPKAEEMLQTTVRALSGWVTTGEVPASVRTLVKGVLKTMLLSKLRTTVVTIFAVTFLAAGLGVVARVGAEDPKAQGEAPRLSPRRSLGIPTEPGGEPWSLSLRDAIRIGLDNSRSVRVISLGAYGIPVGGFEPSRIKKDAARSATDASCVIASLSPDADAQRFRAEVMAEVRSIEQQYWSLVLQHVQLRATEKAVELAREALKREQSTLKVGRGIVSDVAEAQQRLDQFELDLVTKTSDVFTTERQLGNMLGLPPANDRRIVPVTAPVEALLQPDWETSRAVMLEKQPDVLRYKALVEQADLARDGLAQIERAKAFLQQVVHQTTHSLARFFVEVEANYKQFKKASTLRDAAAQRLEAQRAFHEEGRITIDRYLDAVSQYVSTVAQEAQFKTSYNTSIVALEEAKGTLLEYDQITVGESPKSTMAKVARRDVTATPVAHEPPVLVPAPSPTAFAPAPFPAEAPLNTSIITRAKDASPKADLAGKTFSFQMTVGIGSRPVEIRGSFTISPVRPVDAPNPR